jgi:hypothetical protein
MPRRVIGILLLSAAVLFFYYGVQSGEASEIKWAIQILLVILGGALVLWRKQSE